MSDALAKALQQMERTYEALKLEFAGDGTISEEEQAQLQSVSVKLDALRRHVAAKAGQGSAPRTNAAAQAAQRGTGFRDADFVPDAKHRRREDRAPRPPSGKAPQEPAGEMEPDKDALDEQIEEVIGDPKKRLEALAKWKVPRYSAEFDDDDEEPLLAFLKEMKSGTEKANETLKYIETMAERAEQLGDVTGLNEVARTSGSLKKIAAQIGGGLEKWGGRIERAQQAARWFIELDRFAEASSAMDAKDRTSVQAWVSQMKRLWDATAPFAEWANSELVSAAFAGSRAAGAASATMAIVGAQLYVGLEVLDRGVKNVNAYLARLEEIQRQIDREAGNGPALPPPPPFPGEWKSRSEERADALAREERGLRRAVQDAKDAEERKRQEGSRSAEARFDADVLPQLYIQQRPRIVARLLGDLRAAGKKPTVITDEHADATSPESRWWDCLLSDGSDEGRMDPQAGIWVHKPKVKVSPAEAREEIDRFLEVKPPCPAFVALRGPALAQYLKDNVR